MAKTKQSFSQFLSQPLILAAIVVIGIVVFVLSLDEFAVARAAMYGK